MTGDKDATVFDELSALVTEGRLSASRLIDTLPTLEILRVINAEDERVPRAVASCLPQIAEVVDRVAAAFRAGGSLIYVGAGTSGRLGILDAAECPPTFGTKPDEVRALIAGGKESVFRAKEGAEDDPEGGRAAIDEAGVHAGDAVVGIAASRRTPYVQGALRRAKEIGAFTALVTCNPSPAREGGESALPHVDVVVAPVVGPEVIAGSTRMKAGTAQKLVLNMITTAAMIRCGKTYENWMIDLRPGSRKLVERSRRIVMEVAGVGYEDAARLLDRAGGRVKTALVMGLRSVDVGEADALLERAGGFVRRALEA